MMRRRIGLLVTLAFGFLLAPLAADVQPPAKVARIGYLCVAGSPGSTFAEAFRQGLRELGYVEGHTIAIEYRAAERSERLHALAAELVQLPVDVIVAVGGVATQAAKSTTTTVPIVIVSSGDPVATGLVASLARVAVLWNARDPAMTYTFRGIQAAAPALGVTVQPPGVHEAKEIDSAIAAMTEDRPDALFMITDALTRRHMKQVLDFAAQRQLPTLFEGRGSVAEGGLMSYGPSLPDLLRRAAYYVDRLLKGAKPGDLPVEQPMTFELAINLKTAKALGLTIPPTLLFQADEVIR
jgi:putative tryptophan/tyrosine transport system substrate-binding protein